MPAKGPATVWSSAFVPSRSPISEFGQEGYSVAWVDTDDGRFQILVVGDLPAPGARGQIEELTIGEETIEVFVEEPA
jgi:hypothetical protein